MMVDEMRDTGVRYYENDDTIVFSALKVASRYLDSLFYDDDLTKVKEVYYNKLPSDSQLYFKYSDERCTTETVKIDKTLDNVIRRNCKKKVIFLCRHPLKRHIASLNHFFQGYVQMVMSYQISKRFPETKLDFNWHPNAFEQFERQLKEDKLLWISQQNFKVLKDYGKWPANKMFKNHNNRMVPEDVINALKKMALNFIKSESKKNWNNNHYAPYLETYDKIIGPKNIENIRIVDIDKENISNIFNTKKSKVGVSTQWTKLIIEELIKSSKIDLIDSEVIIYNKLMKL
jgi:hypothetical protein